MAVPRETQSVQNERESNKVARREISMEKRELEQGKRETREKSEGRGGGIYTEDGWLQLLKKELNMCHRFVGMFVSICCFWRDLSYINIIVNYKCKHSGYFTKF